MTSQRKIEANRQNAQRSTGPKTEEGKDKVRLNALKHGLCAQTIVLPHEDANAYQQRLDDWTTEMNPRTRQGAYLIERAVRVSWQLDRADFHERARLTRRIQQLRQVRGGAHDVPALLERLLSIPQDNSCFHLPDERDPEPPREDPVDLVARLQSTALGCQALLDRWEGLWCFLARQKDNLTSPMLPDEHLLGQNRIVRLLGWRDPESKIRAIMDRRVDALLQVQTIAFENAARRVLAHGSEDDEDDPCIESYTPPPGPEPELVKQLNEQLWYLVDENHRTLQKRMAECEAEESVADESDEEAAFDDTPEGERLHRYQTQWSRTLRRTFDEIERLHGQTEDEPTAAPRCPCSRGDVHEMEPDEKPCPGDVPPAEHVESTKQSHREVRTLAPSTRCDRRSGPRKAILAARDLDLGASPAVMVQPFTAIRRS